MFGRILVPTDFSDCADVALGHARAIAEKFGSSLHLLHVMEDPVITIAMSAESFIPNLPELRDAMWRDATGKIESRLSTADRVKLLATAEVIFGGSAASIVAYAAMHQTDLIVMGTHGRTGMKHLLLGSVAERVVQTARCAVMTVHEGDGGVGVRVPKVGVAVPA